MRQARYVIKHVAVSRPQTLALTFADGYAAEVDLTEVIQSYPSLARLADPGLFSTVALDESSLGVIFAGEDALTMASDNLRALALEQAAEKPDLHSPNQHT
ncbi:DUF2442 domain-containing protein [Bordetella sp. N]|uniref:DUF2442 domain-containing protein n=1 Tax=Bordetella sp. N TaxID=1746199 RepID=UPI00070D746E|nr:DUF2442 domain-containing protein [Bordetella sp. N]ALM85893.1 hypothetical protein ASB57_25730 [Bordetella sp. N]